VPAHPTTYPIERLSQQFLQLYGVAPKFVRAPGRVNLIGEHTDYNDGFVLPAAIQLETRIGFAGREDRRLALFSNQYREQAEFEIDHLPNHAKGRWGDYVIGVAQKLRERGIALEGASLLIDGDVPQGAGLSSSASLEVATCRALLDVAGQAMGGAEMALLCQRAENEFVGARCGIMDQFVSVQGKKDHALLLDCRSLEYLHQPVPEEVRLVICNTMVRHSVAGGEYNLRRQECENAAKFFAGVVPGVKALRDVSMRDFEKHGAELPEVVQRRCRHVIRENARVLQAGDALAQHDLVGFGRLMYASHESLRKDFEVSCQELDVMVEIARDLEGVYGARMTGGGFGGCTINVVKSESVGAFQRRVAEEYGRAIGQQPEIYVCTAADGVGTL